MFRGIADERVAESAIGDAAVGDDELRHAENGERSFADDRGRTAAGGIGGEVVAVVVGSQQGHEDVAGANVAEIVGAAGDADVARADREIVGQDGAKGDAAGMW